MNIRRPLRLAAVVPVALAATLVACGSSSSTATATGVPSTAIPTAAPTAIPTAAPTATPSAAPVNLTCPSAGTVTSGLGLTMAAPTSEAVTDLPLGDTGIVCTYSATTAGQVVVIDLATGTVLTTFISVVEAGEQKSAVAQGYTFAATNASGVGSQAVIITLSKAGSPTENGILAVSGNTGLSVDVIPPASQSQLQSFASQLLG
jgi:hypothetical protein